jgi:molybdenum cofactor cytidylyltransferase
MPTPAHTLFAAVLAAGCSSRFGSTKQAATLDEIPLVRRAIDTAASACEDRVITVLGHDLATVYRAMGTHSGFIVVNDAYQEGLGSSIAAAARACGPQVDALLLLLADQPLVTPQHLQTLINRWSGADDEIVATAYNGALGPPVLLPRATFDDLRGLGGDQGARALLSDDRFQLKTVRFEAAAVDIDTIQDLAALT